MEIYQKPNHKRYFKSQLGFLILSLIIGIALFTTICFADFTDDFNSPSLDPAWSIVNNGLSYSLTDNPGNLRIYFNGKQGSQGFGYTFSGKQWVFETKVHYNMNPLYSYLGVPAPGQEFGQGLAITGVDAGGKGFELAARVLNGYMDTIIVNALGWEAGEWDAASQYWNGIYGLYSGCGDGTYYFRLIRDNNAFSMFYSIDGISWQQSYSDIEDAGILSDQNSIALGALFNALATTSGTAYVEYDYVKISTGQATLFVKDAVDFSNPNFPRIGQPVLDDPQRLASGGREVKIAVADGVTRLLLMLDVLEQGTADFWVDNSADGLLSSLSNQSNTSTSISNISSVSISQGQKILAVYKVPDNFVSDSHNAYLSEREITIHVKFHPASGGETTTEQKIKLIRPPVMLIHGIWSNYYKSFSVSGIVAYLQNSISGIKLVPVNYPNASSIYSNYVIVGNEIKSKIYSLRNQGIAVSQVDVVAHSMGGVLSRLFAEAGAPNYINKENYNEGYINKLITVDTPHKGALIADELMLAYRYNLIVNPQRAEEIKELVETFLGSMTDGAVDDLRAINLGVMNPLRSINISSHTIVGDILGPNNPTTLMWAGPFYSLLKSLDVVIDNTLPSDGVVEEMSQRGGLSGAATDEFAHIHLGKSPVPSLVLGCMENNQVQELVIFLLNDNPNSSNFSGF